MASQETIETLRGIPILGLLQTDALQVLANVADTRRLKAGEILFGEGDRSDGGYAVMAGEIGIGPEGDRASAQVFGPGSLIGRVALFIRVLRPATAFARSDATVLRVSPTLLKRVIQEYPRALEPIRRAMAQELEGLSAELEEAVSLLGAG